VFEGMPLRSLEYKGAKRDFEITRVVPSKAQRASAVSPSHKIISAYKVTLTTTVDLAGMRTTKASASEIAIQKSGENRSRETA